MVEYISNLTKKSFFILENQYYLYSHALHLRVTPVGRNTTVELHLFHILTVELVDRHDSHTDSSYNLISRFWIAAFCFFIGDISLFSNDYIAFTRGIYFFSRGFFFWFFWRFYLSEKFSNHSIIDVFEYASWLSREIPELYEHIFFIFTIEDFSVDIFEEREFFIESFAIVFFEITTKHKPSFFYKKTSLFTIDKLPDMLSCLWSLHEREPDRIWFFMRICGYRYALAIV